MIKFISCKTMRLKDIQAVKNHKQGYKAFRQKFANGAHLHETLYKTPRGWFLNFKNEEGIRVVGEISITEATRWLNETGIRYNTGW